MRLRLQAEGLSGFQPHEVLELLLFYSIPQRDVNELAHNLIERFGSVEGVLSANQEELTQVPGVGARTARLFFTIRRGMKRYQSAPPVKRPCVTRLRMLIAFCQRDVIDFSEDQDALICLDSGGCVIHCARLDAIGIEAPVIRGITEITLRHHAYNVVIVSCRRDGRLSFTEAEISFSRRMMEMCASLDVGMMDHVLIWKERYASMRKDGILRDPPAFLREERPGPAHWLDEEL